MAENGSKVCIATLSIFLYTRTYLAHKSLGGIVTKSFLAAELHYNSKNLFGILSGRRPTLTQKEFLAGFLSGGQC